MMDMDTNIATGNIVALVAEQGDSRFIHEAAMALVEYEAKLLDIYRRHRKSMAELRATLSYPYNLDDYDTRHARLIQMQRGRVMIACAEAGVDAGDYLKGSDPA